MEDNFIEVDKHEFPILLNWYWDNIQHYDWQNASIADRVNIFANRESSELIAWIDMYCPDGKEPIRYVNKQIFFGGE